MQPTISWIPVRLFSDVLVNKTLTVKQWLDSAKGFGLEAVEVYWPFIDAHPGGLPGLKNDLQERNLRVSLVTCSPDLTHPDLTLRAKANDDLRLAIDQAAALGATGVRCTTGQAHPGLSEQEGLHIVSSSLRKLAAYGAARGVYIALENHYRDRMCMESPDFAHRSGTFLKLFDLVRDDGVKINLDCSNPVMVGENAVDILRHVLPCVVSVHASDRKAGSYTHSSVGEGDVDYPSIFTTLSQSGYSGWFSIEDGQPDGDDGFRKSLQYVRSSISSYWK